MNLELVDANQMRHILREELATAVELLQPRGLTVDETATRIGVSASTIRQLINEGLLPTLDLGDRKRTLIPSPAVDDFLTNHTRRLRHLANTA